MKAILTGVALAAVVAAAPALAAGERPQVAQLQPQAGQQQEEMQNSPVCPTGETMTAEGRPCAPEATGALPAAPAQAGSAATGGSEGAAPDMVAKTGDKFIDEQGDNSIRASELVGLTVYNPADEGLGDVNDIVWTEEGGIEALIVGVGGFLGIGEKQVAVAYDAIDISSDEYGNKKLVLHATSDELAAAPAYMTSAEKLAALRAERQEALPPASGGGMVTAPDASAQ